MSQDTDPGSQRRCTPAASIEVYSGNPFGTRLRPFPLLIAYDLGAEFHTTLHRTLEDLRNLAEQRHQADVIIDLRIEHTIRPLPDGHRSSVVHYVTAYGTPAVLPWPAGHGDPTLGWDPEQH